MAVLNRYNVLIMGDRFQKFTCTRMCNKEIERQKKKSQQISSQSDQFRHVQRHFNVALPAAALLTHIKLANNHNLHIVCIKFNCHVVVFAIYIKIHFLFAFGLLEITFEEQKNRQISDIELNIRCSKYHTPLLNPACCPSPGIPQHT